MQSNQPSTSPSIDQTAQKCADLDIARPLQPAHRNVNDSVYALSDALLLRKLGNRLAAQYGLRPAS